MKEKINDGFKVLPIRLSEKNTISHELFIKEHAVRHHESVKPPNRTLFIVNVAPYINESYLNKAFSSAGAVDNVILQPKQNSTDNEIHNLGGFKIAFVIFKDSGGLKSALNLSSIDLIPINDDTILSGMKKWMKEYNDQICDRDKLEEEVNSFVFEFDKSAERQQKSGKEDNGGWTVVNKKSRRHGNARKESVKNKINEKIAEQDKRKYHTDFYTFQKRDSKMNHLVQMRKKYEEDKKRVAAMKQFRKFKPY